MRAAMPSCVRSSRIALASILLVVACSHSSEAVTFKLVSKDSPSAPVAMASVPGGLQADCAVRCAHTGGCLGFCWLRGLCELFNLSALSDTWRSSGGCELFQLTDAQPCRLGIPGTTVKTSTVEATTAPTIRKLSVAGCTQSSTFLRYYCTFALDGNKEQSRTLMYSATYPAYNEWWQANLTAPSFISYLTIYSRDTAPEWLTIFSLLVDGVECNRANMTVPFSVSNFSCNAIGSAVRVQTLRSQYLILVEVEFYGY